MRGDCSICGVDAHLVEAVSDAQIVRVCRFCADKNNLPVIKRPDEFHLDEVDKRKSVRERLIESNPKMSSKEDDDLKEIVVQNLKEGERDDLVHNFHWHIQHARRMKKISQKQLAESVAEPVVLVEMAEKGKLPDDYSKFVSKLEQFLGIQLFKEVKANVPGKEVNLDKINPFEMKTGDLRFKRDSSNEEEVEFVDDLDKV